MFVDAEVVGAALLGAVGSAPVFPALRRWFERVSDGGSRVAGPLEAARLAGLLGVFVYAVSLMAAGSYSPFIYFRF